jgi:hypothetical protein
MLFLIRDIMGYARWSVKILCATKQHLSRPNLSPNSNSKIELELELRTIVRVRCMPIIYRTTFIEYGCVDGYGYGCGCGRGCGYGCGCGCRWDWLWECAHTQIHPTLEPIGSNIFSTRTRSIKIFGPGPASWLHSWYFQEIFFLCCIW